MQWPFCRWVCRMFRFFFFRRVDGKTSILLQLCPKGSFFQNNEQKNVGNWESKQRFQKPTYNSHIYIMEIAFKAMLSRNPQPI